MAGVSADTRLRRQAVEMGLPFSDGDLLEGPDSRVDLRDRRVPVHFVAFLLSLDRAAILVQ